MKRFNWKPYEDEGNVCEICTNANTTNIENTGKGYGAVINSAQKSNGKWVADGALLLPHDDTLRSLWNPKNRNLLSSGTEYHHEESAICHQIEKLTALLALDGRVIYDAAFIKTLKALKTTYAKNMAKNLGLPFDAYDAAQARARKTIKREHKQRAIPSRIADIDPETEEILRDPEAMAAINACKEGKITRWHTMEEVFGEQ